MANKVLQCGECGRTEQSKFVFDPDGKFFTCVCGAKNRLADSISIVEIEGMATVSSRLRRIEQLVSEGNVDKAESLCKEVLTIQPENYEAWWYRYICADAVAKYYGYADQFGNKDLATQANVRRQNLVFADRAIQYAPDTKKSEYRQMSSKDRQFISDVENNPRPSGGLLSKLFGKKGR